METFSVRPLEIGECKMNRDIHFEKSKENGYRDKSHAGSMQADTGSL
jgi:hypothetical protein